MPIGKKFNLPPAVAGMLSRILEEAWRDLVDCQDPRVLARTLTRDDVARRIMQSALLGERDPVRLKDYAMKAA
jgi:hypothetical protein